MNHYLPEFRFNKKNSASFESKVNTRKRLILSLVSLTLVALLISAPFTFLSVSAIDAEPSLDYILNDLGFTNIALADDQTFVPGIYNITLYAEIAGYHSVNVLSYYEVGTSDYQTLFTGPEGTTELYGGYVVPPLSKVFSIDAEFGITILTPVYRYFTEHSLNPDSPEQHCQVYVNLDEPNMFLIGFENFYGEGNDRDYNDMVFSLVLTDPLEIISVSRSPAEPNYDESVTVTAQVNSGSAEVDSVILGYQIGLGSWVNVTMSLEGGYYVADIPAQPYNTVVKYRVYAADTLGRTDVSALYSYTVDDFVAPVISNIAKSANSPNPKEAVTVSANVTEPLEASGVKEVILWYTTNTVWSSIDMTMQDGLWTATIPGQSAGTTVNFFVEAVDNAENSAKTSTSSYKVKVPNRSPTADFTASPSTVYTDEVVEFDASASKDPDGSITSYVWDFGDGNVGSEVTATHSYVEDGEYVVTLTVTDNKGASDSTTASIVVKNRAPVADVTASATVIDTQETLTFDASQSYDSDGTIVAYAWNFGDGTTATGVSATHSYPDNGSYTVTLTVTDNDGAIDTATITNTIRNQAPVAAFTESNEIVNVNEAITFDAADSYDLDGTIVTYSWDFGDGNTATGVSVSHAYADDGSYVVTLTVTDDDDATNTASATERALNQEPVASFTQSAETTYTDEEIHFDGTGSYDSDGSIVSYAWDFGDGNTATGATVEHTYEDNGVYTVTLTVTDDDGATDSAAATNTVLNKAPIAAFTENVTEIIQNEAIRFDASNSYDLDGTIVTYSWDFGDGNIATGMAVDHTYIEDGNYTVTLTVTDNDGDSSSAVVEKTVEPEIAVSLAVLSVIGLGVASLTASLLYGLFIRRRKKKNSEEN
ncbi:MAG: PKD domain-containing protein [Candidatus Bathyarchaeota archaeon]|nr:PKD domain-containing protein [Candidatus Bathyarchaeum sp.]